MYTSGGAEIEAQYVIVLVFVMPAGISAQAADGALATQKNNAATMDAPHLPHLFSDITKARLFFDRA
ncbi:hypothetical protein [Burkholderia sp. L27(2015)]|uniref:hypothetical protein n=1 Tax=Burkholderia sp. L27(2015) TaxID=1641858 RepID=UPI00131D3CF7|nr:hypothetical protein [Burkholderia sp. L27(2015)]